MSKFDQLIACNITRLFARAILQ